MSMHKSLKPRRKKNSKSYSFKTRNCPKHGPVDQGSAIYHHGAVIGCLACMANINLAGLIMAKKKGSR